MTSGFKATAVHLYILETAREQSPKNANVYEKLNALEHRAEICNRVSLVMLHETRDYEEIATT